MLTTIKPPVTALAYLEAERKSETKNEFFNGKIISMTGASLPHNIITNKIATLLSNILEEKDYIVCQSDMRVPNPLDNSYFYPVVVVIEGEAQLKDDEFDNVLNLVLLVEVLSLGTAGYDQGDKSLFYRHIAPLKEYLIVLQDEAYAEHLIKIEESKWQLEELKGLDKSVFVLDRQYELKLADI